jgi:hypothetical protein
MPFHLQVELAKNHSPIAAAMGPQLGEDIYLFRLQINSLVNTYQTHHPNNSYTDFMNQWHAEQIAAPRTAKSHGVSAADLAVSPMCLEMMRSCGRAHSLFNRPTIVQSNIDHLVTDAGGVSLASTWLDLRTTIKVSHLETYLHSPAGHTCSDAPQSNRFVISTPVDQNFRRQSNIYRVVPLLS